MKIFVSSLYQETNSFSPLATDLEVFRRGKLLEGQAGLDAVAGTNHELSGFLEGFSCWFPLAEVVPGLFAWGNASGPVLDAAWAELADRLIARLVAAGPVDAVVLSLHGSMGSVSEDDCEGEILARIRARVGPGVPIAASLDSHAVLTAKMVAAADLLVGYRTYPHVDFLDTGRRTVAALAAWLQGGRRARAVFRRWPAIIPVDNAQTDSGPVAEVVAELPRWEREAGAVVASFFDAHPWFDTPEHGLTLLAYAPPEAAAALGEKMEAALRRFWERRAELITVCLEPEEFFARAACEPGPVAAIDAGDITTAGAVGDSTVLLRTALAANRLRTLIPLVDAASVDRARSLGEGRTGDFRLGGADAAGVYNARLAVRAEVVRLTDAPLQLAGPSFQGMSVELGPRALLRVGPVELLAVRHGNFLYDPELWRTLSVEPAQAAVIVQKSHKLFRPAYAGIVRRIETVETPGCSDRRLSRLPFRRIRRPIFPLDPAGTFACQRSL